MIERIKNLIDDVKTLMFIPTVQVDLMSAKTQGNDPFYGQIVNDFYTMTQKRHKKLFFMKNFSYGVALGVLSKEPDYYFSRIAASVRRNCKKALRSGYEFKLINFNDYLKDIKEIRQSTTQRQGEVSQEFLNKDVEECTNPISKNKFHDYIYLGILKDNKLYAYAGFFIAGEICMLEHIYGHAQFHSDGVVPLLIVESAQYIMNTYPQVRFYCYGTYFGAGKSMKQFKTRFLFNPYKVNWVLNVSEDKPKELDKHEEKVTQIGDKSRYQYVYRMLKKKLYTLEHFEKADYYLLSNPIDVFKNPRVYKPLFRLLGIKQFIILLIKLLTPNRFFYCMTDMKNVAHHGWVVVGKCRNYWVDPNSVIIGPINTDEAWRGKGVATFALKTTINRFIENGKTIFYIDTSSDNISAQKVFEKSGFGDPVSMYKR